ncbi:MAG: Amuc_1100 family pilus-like protein [Chthoniobacterales bacterium]
MNWFQQNRFLGAFLILFGIATLGSAYFLWSAKSDFAEAKAAFDENATELNRLQQLVPYPSEPNLRKMKTQAEEYASELNKLKEELKTRVLPVVPLAPNEFQTRLRQAILGVGERARANKVKLPDNFFLGFDEFAAALPDTAAAPLLGQQLAQVELLLTILIDARVDAVTSLRRAPASAAAVAAASPSPTAVRKPPGAPETGPALVERSVIETAFVSSPGAARRALNQIATIKQQFYILRTLRVLNEKDKGPPRESAAAGTGAVFPSGSTPPGNALTFIVGNERVQTSARIEMVRFAFQ